MAPLTSLAEVFVLCSGNTTKQVKAIADEVHHELKVAGFMPNSEEGMREALWVLMDYGDVVIHIFERNTRSFYNLERIWGAAVRRPVEGGDRPDSSSLES